MASGAQSGHSWLCLFVHPLIKVLISTKWTQKYDFESIHQLSTYESFVLTKKGQTLQIWAKSKFWLTARMDSSEASRIHVCMIHALLQFRFNSFIIFASAHLWEWWSFVWFQVVGRHQRLGEIKVVVTLSSMLSMLGWQWAVSLIVSVYIPCLIL